MSIVNMRITARPGTLLKVFFVGS